MAGHSKWANIRFRKLQQDNKKGKIFTKLIREITVASRLAGQDLSTNPRLRTAVAKALGQNMSRDTINRAIQKGSPNETGCQLEAVTYEGYGPGASAFMVEALTDNRNRTAGQVRQHFSKAGGQLSASGAASYLFRQQGVFLLEHACEQKAQAFLALVLEQPGLEDLEVEGMQSLLYVAPNEFHSFSSWLQDQDLVIRSSELEWIAADKLDLVGSVLEKCKKLVADLEELEDVQAVYHNIALSETEYGL